MVYYIKLETFTVKQISTAIALDFAETFIF